MPRPSVADRARLYLQEMPPAVSGSGGHDQTFAAACALVKGFALSVDAARPLLAEYNMRCLPPWSEREIEHKLLSADRAPDGVKGRGYLSGPDAPHGTNGMEQHPAASKNYKPAYDCEKLKKFAGEWADTVNLVWLADRSVIDPATVTPEGFLRALYREGERVIIFLNNCSQGEAVWPDDPVPISGARGVWFLCQPTDGAYHPNPRQGKMSRRSRESVTSWRYLVLESDEAPIRLWLGALVRLPLRIAAIYSSGSRSVHALVRLDARTEREWQGMKERLLPGIVSLGADQASMSSVRLTRLPGCYRAQTKRWQKLLYLNPDPPAEPLCEMFSRRNVVQRWWDRAMNLGDNGWPKHEIVEVLEACRYYSRSSEKLMIAAQEISEVQAMMDPRS